MTRRVLSVPTFSPPLVTDSVRTPWKPKPLQEVRIFSLNWYTTHRNSQLLRRFSRGCGHTLPPGLELSSPMLRRLRKKRGVSKSARHQTQKSYRIDTFGTLFEKIILTRILSEVSGRGLLRNKQFGIIPKRNNVLQLASSLKECPGALKRSS